jgi:PAS domain S-box-containing protein
MDPKQDRLALVAGFGLLVVVVLSVLSALSYVSANQWVDHTLEVRQESDEWSIALLDADTAMRGVVSGHPLAMAHFHEALPVERAKAGRVRTLVSDNAAQVRNVDEADLVAHAIVTRLGDLVELADTGRKETALARLATDDGQPLMDAFRVDTERIRAEEDRLLVERRSQATTRALGALACGLLLTIASVASLAYAWTSQRRRAQLLVALGASTRRRLEMLSEVAAALAEVRSRAQVADVVVEHGMRALGADTCTLYMLDEAGTALTLLGESGVAPEIVERIHRITETSGNPQTFATLKSGKAIWAESEADYLAIFPALVAVKSEQSRAKAFWSMPLVVEGRPVGLLGMGFYEARKFPPEERAFIETLTRQCAQALVRAGHLEREDEARRWFATTLRSVGDAVIATDPEGGVTFMNAVAERLSGWDDADARGRKLEEVFSIFSERTRKAAENPVAKVLREGTIVGLANHTVLRSKSGEEIPIDDSAAPIRDDSGKLLGVVMVFRDVTREKREHARREFLARAGEALVSSLDRDKTLATVAGFAVPELADWCAVEILEAGSKVSQQVAVAHVDPTKVRFARELGELYPPDPHATTGVPQVIRTGKSELYREIPEELIERGARDAEHLRLIRELRLHSAMVVPLRARGRVFGAMTFVYAESGRRYTDADLAFAEDFARRAGMAIENAVALKEAEDAQVRERRLRAEAEGASRAKDEFLATVSHELRTPLNSILGWTVMLRGRNPTPELDRSLAIIERNARAQTKLIEDVLDVSRVISGKLALNLGPTNVAEAVAASVENVTPAAEAKGIQVSAEVADASMTITADAHRLQQIVWNILSNAVKFTPKGGAVTVRALREGSSILIRVSDTGEGMRPETILEVFEPFKQADASTTRRHGGLGLGLAIVKHLVTAHGGTVEAQSEGLGKGATFIVCLPARSAVPAVSPATALVPAGPLPRLDGLRVLVVDDEEDARLLVGDLLGQQGAIIHLAASASEALEMLSEVRPDVVVSDIGMPQMDGYSLIRKIRSLPATRGGRTPAVALTAYARTEDAQRAFAAGFQTHVTKPIEPAQLATVVANVGGLSQDPVS